MSAPAPQMSPAGTHPAPLPRPGSPWQVAVAAVRPRTLSLAVTPVLLGSAIGWSEQAPVHGLSLLLALACALLIQIGTNLHNDVADFRRGTDGAARIGPLRVTAAGWVAPRVMVRASLACFGAALLLGVALVQRGGWPILAVGVASLLSGWAYSGGPRPISRGPWGELFVWLFFGLVAVVGSHWLQAQQTTAMAWLAGAALGAPAAAVLLVNNHRDRDEDARSGRRTLAIVLGDTGSAQAYALLLALPLPLVLAMAALGRPGALLALAAGVPAFGLWRRLGSRPAGPWLNGQLAATARTASLFGLLLAVGVLL